jgi:biopolymer transport protein ExbB
MLTQEELIKWLKLGGVTLGIILFCSILAVAVFVERVLAQRSFRNHLLKLSEKLRGILVGPQASLDAAKRAITSAGNNAASRIFLVGVDAQIAGADLQKVNATVDRERQRAGLQLRRWMWILGTIGSTSPFIGLFGTVLGILRAMREIGGEDKSIVAEGISEALVTTAVGIAIALEAVVLFNWLQNRLQTVTLEMRLSIEEFLEDLRAVRANTGAEASEPKERESKEPKESKESKKAKKDE